MLERALDRQDLEFLDQYGGMQEAINRYIALGKLPEAELAEGVSIDDYSTFRATRFAEPGMRGHIYRGAIQINTPRKGAPGEAKSRGFYCHK